MNPDLQSLLTLQEKDKTVDGVTKALGALAPELKALDDELANLARAIDDARRGVAGAEARRSELEHRIQGFKAQQNQRKQQLDFVRGAKEHSTLSADIEMMRGVLVKEEADFARSGDAIIETEKRVKDAEKAHAAAVERQAEARAALDAKRGELLQQLEAAKSDRAVAAKDVAPQHLTRYERTRRGRAPLAVYALLRDSCGHCFTAVPVQRRVLIQQGVSIESCEVCGVLLYAADA